MTSSSASASCPTPWSRDVAPGVDLAVGTERMANVEMTLAGEMMREQFLRQALEEQIAGYDLVLIDCPPNLGLLTVNAFCAAPEVMVVVSMTDRNAYKGAMALLSTVNRCGATASMSLSRASFATTSTGTAARTGCSTRRSSTAGCRCWTTEIPMRADFQNAVTAGRAAADLQP